MMHAPTLNQPRPDAAPRPSTPAAAGVPRAARAAAWSVVLVLVLGGAVAVAAPAEQQPPGAVPAAGGPSAPAAPATDVSGAGAVRAEWDGPTTHLDWTGRTYATAEATFLGDRVAAPGDRSQRTLRLTNAGPSDGVLTVTLVLTDPPPRPSPEAAAGPGQPAGAGEPAGLDGDGLDAAVDLFWDVAGVAGHQRFAALRGSGREVEVAHVRVPRGETSAVTVGFTMPAEVTGARAGGTEGTALRFGVVARLQGETGPAGIPALALTGARLAGAVALVLGLVGAGVLLAAARGGARCEGCGAVVPRVRGRVPTGAAEWGRCARCGPCPAPSAPVGGVRR